MTGESKSSAPTMGGSSANIALGELARALVEENQLVTPFDAMVVQSEGNDGAVTASKFWVSTKIDCPRANGITRVPRLVEPSESAKVAFKEVPQRPLPVNVKERETAAPPPLK